MPVPAVEGVVGDVELLLVASLAHFLLQYRCTLVASTNFGFCPQSYKGGMRQRLKGDSDRELSDTSHRPGETA